MAQESGQLTKPNEDQRSVGLEARQRHYGITKEQALRPECVDVAKRSLIKELGRVEAARYFPAIDEIRSRHDRYLRAIKAPCMRSAADLDGNGRGYDNSTGTDPNYVRSCQRAIRDWKEVNDALLACGKAGTLKAVLNVVLHDQPAGTGTSKLVRALANVERELLCSRATRR